LFWDDLLKHFKDAHYFDFYKIAGQIAKKNRKLMQKQQQQQKKNKKN
jgi:hypothetical protein